MEIAKVARQSKDERAVEFAQRRLEKTENRPRKPVLAPVPKTGTGNAQSPVPETGTTGSVPLPVPLSISRVGERLCRGCWACARRAREAQIMQFPERARVA
jgi:hypothetical protein